MNLLGVLTLISSCPIICRQPSHWLRHEYFYILARHEKTTYSTREYSDCL